MSLDDKIKLYNSTLAKFMEFSEPGVFAKTTVLTENKPIAIEPMQNSTNKITKKIIKVSRPRKNIKKEIKLKVDLEKERG